MKVGLFAMNYATCANPDVAVRIAQYAESAGLESLWTGEHVVLPSTPPGGSRLPAGLPFLDSVVGLSMLAMATDRIKIGSGIIELPLHNPVLLAKQLASIDQISRGRLIAGFGAGYMEAEFAAVGVSLADRGTSPAPMAGTCSTPTLRLPKKRCKSSERSMNAGSERPISTLSK